MSADEKMPCPKCAYPHRKGEYVHRPELATSGQLGALLKDKRTGQPYPPGHECHGVRYGTPVCPRDVTCRCGAILRHTVPLFHVGPYGWHWTILDVVKQD